MAKRALRDLYKMAKKRVLKKVEKLSRTAALVASEEPLKSKKSSF